MLNEELVTLLKTLSKQFDTKQQIQEFVAAFDAALSSLHNIKSHNDLSEQSLLETKAKMEADYKAALADLKAQFDALKASIPKPKDGKTPIKGVDYFDGVSPDPAEIAAMAKALIEPPPQLDPVSGELIRNELEALQGDDRLDKSAVKGIDELEKKITEVSKRPSGGGGMSRIALELAMSKMIKHEVFATTSATTSITLSNKVAGNVVIWARYNGQIQSLGVNYNVSGTIVTPTFTLDDDSEWEFTYFAA